MARILGLDLGTNSIGWAIRDTSESDNQITEKGVLTFEKGVGEDQGKEVPLVQKRTQSRSRRRNYQARKYRKWELLKALILCQPRLCPLSMEELDGWRKYSKGSTRVYPKTRAFVGWLRLDFDGDGQPDFINPYVLRAEASRRRFDDPFILGRVFYHMVQRRGFRGREEEESKTILDGSKEKGTIGASEIQRTMQDEQATLGEALYLAQQKYHERIRNRYNLRSDVEAELIAICKMQGIERDSDLFRKLHKSIIWQRPLRTQRSNVGRCTLEPTKTRCPISNPYFEEYRAWCFINNIRVRKDGRAWERLSDEQRKMVFEKVYLGKKKNRDQFAFSEISKCLDKKGGTLAFNFRPDTNVSGCPVTFSLQEIFGAQVHEIKIPHPINKKRRKGKNYYDHVDLWHILFSFDSKEKLESFAKEKLGLDDEKARGLSQIRIPKGYASLSLSAINKILPFLRRGLIYTEAVYLANLPRVIGKDLKEDEIERLVTQIRHQIVRHKDIRESLGILNSLIADYLGLSERKPIEGPQEVTHEDDQKIVAAIIERIGRNRWEDMSHDEREGKREFIVQKWQEFLQAPRTPDHKSVYHSIPRLDEFIKDLLKAEWHIEDANLRYLYHPSETELYAPARDVDGKRYLGDPVPISRGFKNPMALKTLHHLKRLVNYLIAQGTIDAETRIVVEIARELNDANKRKAIERYQRDREKQNKEYAEALKEFTDQVTDQLIDKYRLWIEQGRQCLYTGKQIINLTELIDGTKYDLEHTIPADISFDNELKNLTVADTVYNRQIKQKRIPTELINYENDAGGYTAIKPRLRFMEEKVEHFRRQVEFWRGEARKASTKDRKDYCIQQRHYNQFELDYWFRKLDTFTLEEYKPQWRNSQLRDTQVITKYAMHYLKTVFPRVEVQKGSIVAEFRKIFNVGFQKDRSKHTHHTIDAAVLTLIPSPARRDWLLQAHFHAMENNTRFHSIPSNWRNFSPSKLLEVEKDTVVNFISQDRTLVPTRKFVRKRGRIQYLKEKTSDGKWRFKMDEQGKRIPILAQGDSIRGQLHKETFYGAIKLNSDDEPRYVVRVLLKDFTSEKEIADIVDERVKWAVATTVSQRIQEGKTFKEAMAEPIWMLDSAGNPKQKDRNGKALLPIRHVRCFARAGRGYFKKALPLKSHEFLSRYEHKQWYYVQNELNYLFLLYEGESNGKVLRSYRIINLLDLVDLGITDPEQFRRMPEYLTIERGEGKNRSSYHLKHVLRVGQRILLWKNSPEELVDLDEENRLKRLYRIYKFNEITAPTAYVYLRYHNEARQDSELDEAKEFFPEKYQPLLALRPDMFNCLIENVHFEITLDGIIRMKQ